MIVYTIIQCLSPLLFKWKVVSRDDREEIRIYNSLRMFYNTVFFFCGCFGIYFLYVRCRLRKDLENYMKKYYKDFRRGIILQSISMSGFILGQVSTCILSEVKLGYVKERQDISLEEFWLSINSEVILNMMFQIVWIAIFCVFK